MLATPITPAFEGENHHLADRGLFSSKKSMIVNANLLVSNNLLESRMRENRQSGSEGGGPT